MDSRLREVAISCSSLYSGSKGLCSFPLLLRHAVKCNNMHRGMEDCITAKLLICCNSSPSVVAEKPSLKASWRKYVSTHDQSSTRNTSSLIPVLREYLPHSWRKKLQSDSFIPALTVGLVGFSTLTVLEGTYCLAWGGGGSATWCTSCLLREYLHRSLTVHLRRCREFA